MVEAVMIWNEPNNLSHWDFELDPGWRLFGDLVSSPRLRLLPNGQACVVCSEAFRPSTRTSC